MPCFEYCRDKRGEWTWLLKDRKGNILAESHATFISMKELKQNISAVRCNALFALKEQNQGG